jgi:hypothetical protein
LIKDPICRGFLLLWLRGIFNFGDLIGISQFVRIVDIHVGGMDYPVDYVMSVKLKVDKGSDIPLYDQRIELTNWPRIAKSISASCRWTQKSQ